MAKWSIVAKCTAVPFFRNSPLSSPFSHWQVMGDRLSKRDYRHAGPVRVVVILPFSDLDFLL
jgi:hypothetical protein